MPLSIGGQAAWVPLGVMGVPANTAQPENAALFIQTALSPEVQASMDTTYRSSLPVTREGGHQQFLRAAGMMREQLSEGADFEYLYPSFVEGLTTPCIADQYSKSMVSMGALGILTGEMDVAEAVEYAQRALQAYLAEKW